MQPGHLPHFHFHQPISLTSLKHEAHEHLLPIIGMFVFYVIPLSALAPLMFYYAGTHFDIVLLSALSHDQLIFICTIFFVAEVTMSFILAGFIEWLGNATLKITHTRYEMLNSTFPKIEIDNLSENRRHVDFRDAYTLAAITNTPLWLTSLVLVVPNFTIIATVGIIALCLSMYILYSATPKILKIENRGEGVLLGWVLITISMVGGALMMYLTLISWSYIISRSYL